MKKYFSREAAIATVFVMLIIWGLVRWGGTKLFEPGKHDFEDFDNTDLAFSPAFLSKGDVDTSIVIIDIGDTGRAGIAAIIAKAQTCNPKAIGVDILFDEHKDRTEDSILRSVISLSQNVVFASAISEEGENVLGVFGHSVKHYGYANFYGEENYVARYFPPFRKSDTSFAASVIHLYSTELFTRLKDRGATEEVINYRRSRKSYLIYDCRALLGNRIELEALKNKIVLIGACSTKEFSTEDMHYSPMNEKMLARSMPDMEGIVIQANIISMILEANYVSVAPNWLNFLMSVLLLWLFVPGCIYRMAREFKSYHIFVRIVQVGIVGIITLIDVFLLKCNIRTDLRFGITLIIMSVEMLFLYEMLACYLHRKFKFKTIFKCHSK